MDKLTKVWQVWNRTKINRLECDTHKNVRANRVKLWKWTTRKLRATKNVFKVECCGSSLLTFNRKIWVLGKLLISKRNRKQESAVKVVVNRVHTVNLKQKVTYEGGRESDWCWWLPTCDCIKVQCTIQRVQPDRGHHCGSKHNKRYDSPGLLSDK